VAKFNSSGGQGLDDKEGGGPNLYFDAHLQMHSAKIAPGELYASKRDITIVTVLGSCVSTCLRDPVAKVGGMNHFMLPDRGGARDSPVSEPARYGAHAMEMLINNLLSIGAARDRLEAKIFGAGRVLPGLSDVGARNAEFAIEYLARERISLLAQDVGGEHARKIYFFIASGKVLVKQLRHLHNETLLSRERRYAMEIEKSTVSGRVDLFS